ncbi:hypothetical protein [Rhodanobacter sp. OR87]|uniref:hypothetical protein n=1 Tax=Rhodanobacter sp. OR87 TaxID=1076523 RepID=UPI000412E33F|nr:hypothetical protein [Rhodanobacter sp. OR87]
MEPNRELQLALLTQLRETYPKSMHTELFLHRNEKDVLAQLAYLADHGLVNCKLQTYLSGEMLPSPATITARGIDFLADDGGLSAILGVVTIKLHEDTLKDLIAAKIQQADLPPHDKKRWTDALQALPAETTKHLVLKLLDMGLSHGHEAMHALGTMLGMSP